MPLHLCWNVPFSVQAVRVLFPLTLCCILLISGCSKEDLKQAYQDAKARTGELSKKTSDLAEKTAAAVEQHLPESGSVELRADSPIGKASSAQIELIVIGDGRPASVQICSYDADSSGVTYPAICLHGPTEVTSVASLSGKRVSCDLYVQASQSDPVAMTSPGQSAEVTFGTYNAEEESISATIAPVDLIRSDDQTMTINGGTIVAVTKGDVQ